MKSMLDFGFAAEVCEELGEPEDAWVEQDWPRGDSGCGQVMGIWNPNIVFSAYEYLRYAWEKYFLQNTDGAACTIQPARCFFRARH